MALRRGEGKEGIRQGDRHGLNVLVGTGDCHHDRQPACCSHSIASGLLCAQAQLRQGAAQGNGGSHVSCVGPQTRDERPHHASGDE